MGSLNQSSLRGAFKWIAADPVRRGIAKVCNRGRIPVGYCNIPNWGDALNPVLVELLSGRKVQHLDGLFHDRYLVIGSVLGAANARAEVWGSGFIESGARVLEPPRAIHAVRGPLTRAALLKAGIECPEVYGDPALLLPRFFNPEVKKKHQIGIVPHFSDKGHPWVERYRNDSRVLIIDIEAGIGDFVRSVKSCEIILSSSLHGLICADAYGIPNAWIKLSDILLGGSFKFRDYRCSISAKDPTPIDISTNPPLDDAIAAVEFHELRIDLRRLLMTCPFLDDSLREEVSTAHPDSCGLPKVFSKCVSANTTDLSHLF